MTNTAFLLGAAIGPGALLLLVIAVNEYQTRQRRGPYKFHWTCPTCGLLFQCWEERHMLAEVGRHTLRHGHQSTCNEETGRAIQDALGRLERKEGR